MGDADNTCVHTLLLNPSQGLPQRLTDRQPRECQPDIDAERGGDANDNLVWTRPYSSWPGLGQDDAPSVWRLLRKQLHV